MARVYSEAPATTSHALTGTGLGDKIYDLLLVDVHLTTPHGTTE